MRQKVVREFYTKAPEVSCISDRCSQGDIENKVCLHLIG